MVMGATLQVLAHALRTWLPPFPLFAVTFFFASLGQAYQDTYANTFVASVKAAHRWLGFIHAMYMAGCLAGPFISTAVASAGARSRWELFYTAPLGLGVINFALVVFAFRESLALKRPTQGEMESSREARQKGPMQEIQKTLAQPSVWILSLYFFFFLGAVITAGGKFSTLSYEYGCLYRRLDRGIPGPCPQWRPERHGICPCRLLRWRFLRSTDLG